MARMIVLFLVFSLAGVASCDLDINVCDLREADNSCSDDDDCVLVLCGVSCCACELVASRRQLDEAYCMVEAREGLAAARDRCQEARDTICDSVNCSLEPCPHPTAAVCEAGRCSAR